MSVNPPISWNPFLQASQSHGSGKDRLLSVARRYPEFSVVDTKPRRGQYVLYTRVRRVQLPPCGMGLFHRGAKTSWDTQHIAPLSAIQLLHTRYLTQCFIRPETQSQSYFPDTRSHIVRPLSDLAYVVMLTCSQFGAMLNWLSIAS